MPSSEEVVARIESNVCELEVGFQRYLRLFHESGHFAGPSLYFHAKTIEFLLECGSSIKAIWSDDFFDWLYATLTSWGMHRMGPGNTKLLELADIKQSVRVQEAIIKSIQGLSLSTIPSSDFPEVADKVQILIDSIRVSRANARIVANTKCLHHILPALVPPIDRTYTYNFFYGRTNLTIPEPVAFREMFTFLHRIAVEKREVLTSGVGRGWDTSETKVIDNAIVGFGLARQVVPDADGEE